MLYNVDTLCNLNGLCGVCYNLEWICRPGETGTADTNHWQLIQLAGLRLIPQGRKHGMKVPGLHLQSSVSLYLFVHFLTGTWGCTVSPGVTSPGRVLQPEAGALITDIPESPVSQLY